VVFDGVGGEASGTIAAIEKRRVTVAIENRTDTVRELQRPLELLVGLPKGDRQKLLVDSLVQLGVQRLVPMICRRGVAQPNGAAIARLQRAVIETSKQCGRNRLMEIIDPISVGELVKEPCEGSSGFAHPYGTEQTLPQAFQTAVPRPAALRMAIGPEGGFDEHEVDSLLQAGWQRVSLGARLLRVETAATMVAAWWASYECAQDPGDQ
jgi:16S rRNA (uracil1498-N3)-methyltransferase